MELIHALSMARITHEQATPDWDHILQKEWVSVVSSMYDATQAGFYHAVHHFSDEVLSSPRIQKLIISRLSSEAYEVETNSFLTHERPGLRISWEKFSDEFWEED